MVDVTVAAPRVKCVWARNRHMVRGTPSTASYRTRVSRVAQTPASARRLAPCEEVADQRREAARHSLEAQPWSQSESCRGPGHASTSYRCSHA